MPRPPRPRLLSFPLPAALGLGALLFLGGLAAARTALVEWRERGPGPRGPFLERYQQEAGRLGVAVLPGRPQVVLRLASSRLSRAWEAERAGRPGAAERVDVRGAGMRVEVTRSVTRPSEAAPFRLILGFSLDGKLRTVATDVPLHALPGPAQSPLAARRLETSFASLLLAPGERLAGRREVADQTFYTIAGSLRPELLVTETGPGFRVDRRPGDAAWGVARLRRGPSLAEMTQLLARPVGFLAAVGLFFAAAVKGRLDLVNGSLVAALALATLAPAALADAADLPAAAQAVLEVVPAVLSIGLLWSVGESLLRTWPDARVQGLDALRARRLGPRGGQALLFGLAAGAALAGAKLAVLALAAIRPPLWPAGASLALPLYEPGGNPFSQGLLLAAVTLVLLAVARRLERGWAAGATGVAAAALAALAGWPVPLAPWPASLAANFLFWAAMLALCHRRGPVASTTAALAFFLLPAAAFSALHADWLPGSLLTTAGALAGLAAAGWRGLSRPPTSELAGLKPPAFQRRAELEKRLKEEMDLLAQMQLGLLPRETPRLAGWDLAARSLLAHEAGGDLYDFLTTAEGALWVAAGDVSGHGHSCAIAQAMTKAALVSLIPRGSGPAEILAEVDRVLRTAGAHRSFTSLALLRIDPGTGAVRLSNAGHPYPLLCRDREVEEIALPSLPLGQGPAREIGEVAFSLPPGSVLVFGSDGLFEATDWNDEPYGFERPREVILAMRHRPAGEILAALLADVHRHLAGREAADDTTIVVVKREIAGG